MSKIILIGGVVILGAGAFFLFQSSSQEQEEADMMGEGMVEEIEEMMEEGMNESGNEMMREDEMPMMAEHTVVYSDGGYAPKELTVKKGEKVTFRNESSHVMWPASAMHPAHAEYPGSGLQKCTDSSVDKSTLFDSCSEKKSREEWSFQFQEVGTWNYHDHRRAEYWGTIIVE